MLFLHVFFNDSCYTFYTNFTMHPNSCQDNKLCLIAGELFLFYGTSCGHCSVAALLFSCSWVFVWKCHAAVVQHSASLVSSPADLGDEAVLSMGIMLWAGILVIAFVLLLLAVDVTCYFVNKCGLIMCLCGKSSTGTKGHHLEEGKAAFMWVSATSNSCRHIS